MTIRNALAGLPLLAGLLALAAWPAAAHAINFTGPTNYTIMPAAGEHGPQGVGVGDFNGDSRLDLAVAFESDSTVGVPPKVSIFVGGAGGTFTASGELPLPNHYHPLAIAVGNFNGDSDPDLAVADEGSPSASVPGHVSIFLGSNSTGASFTGPTDFATSNLSQSVAIGDFNGDSKSDLAVANLEDVDGAVPGTVSILLGAGTGSFGSRTNIGVGTLPRDLLVGEFNGDSDPDVAVVNEGNGSSGGQSVSVLLGTDPAGATFSGPTSFTAAASGCVLGSIAPTAITSGDFNGDSDPDLVLADPDCKRVIVLLGIGGGGTFGAPTGFSVSPNLLPDAVAVGDFNGDLDPDLAVANQGSNNVSILRGSSGGTFTAPTDFVASYAPTAIEVSEFNGDADPDLVVVDEGALDFSAPGGVSILLGDTRYQRPIGASPMRVPLVPAFDSCVSANSIHGEPLNFGSCNPPSPSSSTVKSGSGAIGYANLLVCNVGAGPAACHESAPGFTSAMQPDLRIWGVERDLQCRLTGTPSGCTAGSDYNPNGASGPYTTICAGAGTCGGGAKPNPFCAPGGSSSTCIAGSDVTLTAGLGQPGAATIDPTTQCGSNPTCLAFVSKFVGHGLRVTDQYNCAPSLPSGDPDACPASASTSSRPATMVDLQFPVPLDCLADPEPAVAGSNCGVNTTANAIVPGSVITGKKTVVELGEIQLYDSGADGTRGNTDDQRFAAQGIYIP
jgi:hypothetical protein